MSAPLTPEEQALSLELMSLERLEKIARQSVGSSSRAAYDASLAEIQAKKTLREIQLRITNVRSSLNLPEVEHEPDEWQIRESSRADAGDTARKQEQEQVELPDPHEAGIPA